MFFKLLSKIVYHRTLLLFSDKGHVINNVMTTRYITLSAGLSNVIMKSVTTMQIFIQINFEGDKIAFERSYVNRNLILVTIS